MEKKYLKLVEDVSTEHEVRVQKVKDMELEGLKPWPSFKPVTMTCAGARDSFVDGPESLHMYSLAGRMISRREHGKTIFCNIQDRSGSIQVYVKQDNIGAEAFDQFKKFIDVGDILWVRGPIFKTKMGEVTLKAEELSLLSKCLHPLPEKYHGLVDVEQRYRQRYLDLISNPESRERFMKRSRIIQSVRDFLVARDFLEVETPMLHPIAGGAAARPFMTHHNAYDMDLYLRIAPELYLKRLVVGGFDRVFEINRSFRNEGISTRHNPEFTTLEFYMAYGDYRDGMALTEQMIQVAIEKNIGSLDVEFGEKKFSFKTPFRRLMLKDSLIEVGGFSESEVSEKNIDVLLKKKEIGFDKKVCYGEKLYRLFEVFVEGKLTEPTFIIGYPVEISPLAKRDPENPNFAARFELFVAGMELANGFTELNDPFDQADRFKQQLDLKESGDEEAHNYDEDFIRSLEYGLPPSVGVGVGIDRLVMLLTGTTSIKDVILFPTLKKLH